MPEQGSTISSPCEPNGSDEQTTKIYMYGRFDLNHFSEQRLTTFCAVNQ